jgi:hydrogenase maturation protein HypF
MTGLCTHDGIRLHADDETEVAATVIRDGLVLEVLAPGGSLLVCDATSDTAVRRLRKRSACRRQALTVIVRSVAEGRRVAHLTPDECRRLHALTGRAITARQRDRLRISGSVPLRNCRLRLTLPPSALLQRVGARAGVPLAVTDAGARIAKDAEATHRLESVADLILVDSEIAVPIRRSAA